MAKKTSMIALRARNLKPLYVVVNDRHDNIESARNDGNDYSTLRHAQKAMALMIEDEREWLYEGESAGMAIVKVSYELVGQPTFITKESY